VSGATTASGGANSGAGAAAAGLISGNANALANAKSAGPASTIPAIAPGVPAQVIGGRANANAGAAGAGLQLGTAGAQATAVNSGTGSQNAEAGAGALARDVANGQATAVAGAPSSTNSGLTTAQSAAGAKASSALAGTQSIATTKSGPVVATTLAQDEAGLLGGVSDATAVGQSGKGDVQANAGSISDSAGDATAVSHTLGRADGGNAKSNTQALALADYTANAYTDTDLTASDEVQAATNSQGEGGTVNLGTQVKLTSLAKTARAATLLSSDSSANNPDTLLGGGATVGSPTRNDPFPGLPILVGR